MRRREGTGGGTITSCVCFCLKRCVAAIDSAAALPVASDRHKMCISWVSSGATWLGVAVAAVRVVVGGHGEEQFFG